MGYTYVGSNRKIKAYLGSDSGFIEVDRMYYGNIRVYPNAGNVTYVVDNGISYIEEVDIDDSCLSPTTFTPSKSGWTFIGWREDTAANSSVLSSKIMDGNDVTLYAVFRQTITLSYNGNGATGGSTASQSGTRYYNNGNTANPSFVLKGNGYSRTDHSFINWRMGSASGSAYNPGASVALSGSTVFYAAWDRIRLAISAGSIYFSTIRNEGTSGNGSSGSSATISGNNISIHFTSTSWRTHIVVVAAGPWSISGFTKCSVTIEGRSSLASYIVPWLQ